MKVKDAMHPGVTWVGPETSITDLARSMRDDDIGAIPIGENDRLIGMVTDRDIVVKGCAGSRDISTMTARDVMSEPILYCRADQDMDDAIRLMEIHQVRRLPVIDANKRMVGMLSIGDVAAFTNRDLLGEVVERVAIHHA
jgi:CBS domain-containing protein